MTPAMDKTVEVSQAAREERLAQFLHDEGGFDEAWGDRTWPEHPGDTGQREGGFVKIVPTDVQAKFRDVARRALTSSALQSTTRATQPEAALREALEVAHALKEATDLAVGLHARHYSHVKQWKPFPDLRGIISQIDNMTAGLIRPPIDAVTGKERS